MVVPRGFGKPILLVQVCRVMCHVISHMWSRDMQYRARDLVVYYQQAE